MKFIKIFVLAIFCISFLQACRDEGEPAIPAEEVVQQGFSNLVDAKSANYEITFKGEIKSLSKKFEPMPIEGILSGLYDDNDENKLLFSLGIDASLVANTEKKQSVKAEMRLIDQGLYFSITDLKGFDDQVSPEMFGSFLNKWWVMSIPEETQKNTQEQEQAKDLLKNAKLFKDIKYIDSEKISGVKCYHYEVALDKNALAEYLTKTSAIGGQTSSDLPGIGSLTESLKPVEFTGEMWISKDDMTIRRVGGHFIHSNLSNNSLDLEATYTVDNLGKVMSLEAPKDAVEFDLNTLLGGLAPQGAGNAGGSAAPQDAEDTGGAANE